MQNLAAKDPARAALIEAMLAAPDDLELERSLLAHGRVQDGEVPILAGSTTSRSAATRRNATKLLTSRSANSVLAASTLRERVLDTSDVKVWSIAILCLLEIPANRSLATAHSELRSKALASKDATEFRAGLTAGLLAGDAAARASLDSALNHPDDAIRKVAIAALSATGDPSFAPLLLARLATERLPGPLNEIVAALVASSSPKAKTAMRQAFAQADITKSMILITALHDQLRSARPWVDELLVEMASHSGPLRKTAIEFLIEENNPQQVIPLCLKVYEEAPLETDPSWTENLFCQKPCSTYLSRLANRPLQGAEAMAFARQWLQDHRKPG